MGPVVWAAIGVIFVAGRIRKRRRQKDLHKIPRAPGHVPLLGNIGLVKARCFLVAVTLLMLFSCLGHACPQIQTCRNTLHHGETYSCRELVWYLSPHECTTIYFSDAGLWQPRFANQQHVYMKHLSLLLKISTMSRLSSNELPHNGVRAGTRRDQIEVKHHCSRTECSLERIKVFLYAFCAASLPVRRYGYYRNRS